MGSEDAVEIVRASLALAFPTASTEGLTRAAETLIRWGSEDVEAHLDEPLIARMLLDLLELAGVDPANFRPAEPEWNLSDVRGVAAPYRTWSHSEDMSPLPFLPRPPDEPRGPHDPDPPFRSPRGPRRD